MGTARIGDTMPGRSLPVNLKPLNAKEEEKSARDIVSRKGDRKKFMEGERNWDDVQANSDEIKLSRLSSRKKVEPAKRSSTFEVVVLLTSSTRIGKKKKKKHQKRNFQKITRKQGTEEGLKEEENNYP